MHRGYFGGLKRIRRRPFNERVTKKNDTQDSRSHDPGEGPALLAAHTHRVLAALAAPEAVLVRVGQRDLDLRVETEPRVTTPRTGGARVQKKKKKKG